MSDTGDDHIELAVRRLLAKEELEIRKVLTSEIEGYRGFLQDQFRLLTWSLGVLLVVASGLLIFYFGRSKEDIENTMRREIDQKVIEYQIVDSYKQRLQEYIRAYANGNDVKRSVDDAVKAAAGQYVDASVEGILRAKVAEEISKTNASEVEAILKRALTELGGVEARIAALRQQLDGVNSRRQIEGDNIAATIVELQKRMENIEISLQRVAQSNSGQAVGTPMITTTRVRGYVLDIEECGPNRCFNFVHMACQPGPCRDNNGFFRRPEN